MNNRTIFITILCVCALCMLLASCTSGVAPEGSGSVKPSAPVNTTAEPAETSSSTAEPTEAPAATAEPVEQSAAFFDEWLPGVEVPVRPSVLFSGDTPADGAPHEFVYAYSRSASPQDEPVLAIPYAVAVEAENRLYDYLEERFVSMTERSDELFFDCAGLCGEDWFALESVELNKTWQHLYTIWRRDAGGNWYEFGSSNAGEPATINGICFLSETTGFMSCLNFGYYGDSRMSRLFASFDGGETWRDMGLTLPEEYEGYDSYYLSGPVFEGENGAVFTDIHYDNDTIVRRGCFITSDGGHSWRFRELDTE